MLQNMANFWSLSLGHSVERKPLISEEWHILHILYFEENKWNLKKKSLKNFTYLRLEQEDLLNKFNLLSPIIFFLDGDFQLEICHVSKVNFSSSLLEKGKEKSSYKQNPWIKKTDATDKIVCINTRPCFLTNFKVSRRFCGLCLLALGPLINRFLV